ncbi:MAG TPA: FkbM family methyltransferase [Candidatus Dojkabacteria bacterium]|nr:FkbM family methyltransferase [Candidatus Dojkabacteria bacterium]
MVETKLSKYLIAYNNSKEYHQVKSEVFTNKIYHLDYLSKISKPVIIDIGAHIGIASLYFNMQNGDSIIYAYEPNPTAFILLEHNININSLQSQVFISPNAISANNGLIDLYIDKNIEDQNWTSVSSIITDGWQSKIEMESIKVNAITLDKAIENCYKSPDIIKIDVEGAEYKIIEKSKLINQATYLIIELHPIAKRSRQESIKKIRRILSKKGFIIEEVRLDDEELSVIIAKIIS